MYPKRSTYHLMYLLCCLLLQHLAVCQKVNPDITSLHIKSDIKYRFATTLVTSRVVNHDNVSRGVLFDVNLPNEAFITNFTLEINEKVYVGEVKEKEEAKKQFEEAKQKGESTGLVSAKPRETNKFNIQVHVAASSHVIFNLYYKELLKRTVGVYEHVIYVNPGQIVSDLKVEVAIEESRNITTLRVPPLLSDLLSDRNKGTNEHAVIKRPSGRTALITYILSEADQMAINRTTGASGQFIVEYDIDRTGDAGEVLVVSGYFVHFFAPKDIEAVPKDVLFILDKSGSMSGKKIQQLREAMLNILDDLQDNDRFNLMVFDSTIKYWKPDTLVVVNKNNIDAAKSYINSTTAGGLTNINEAMLEGIKLMNRKTDLERAPVLIFLTDGHATTGVTKNELILSNITKHNVKSIPIFSLAFGDNADHAFVRKVAAQNDGFGRKIYEDSDAALQIESFYDELSTVLLKNITFNYLDGTVEDITELYFNTYFSGSEIVVAGKITGNKCPVCWTSAYVSGLGNNGYVTYKSPKPIIPVSTTALGLITDDDFRVITEKLWAYLSIKQKLKKMEATSDELKQEKMKKKIIMIAKKYNFVTPLTSMVVTLPDLIWDILPDLPKESPPVSSGTLSGGLSGRLPSGGFGTLNGGPTGRLFSRSWGFAMGPQLSMAGNGAAKSAATITKTALSLTTTKSPNTSVVIDTFANPNTENLSSKTVISEVRISNRNHSLIFKPDQYTIDSTVYNWSTDSFSYQNWLVNSSYKLEVSNLKNNRGLQILASLHRGIGIFKWLLEHFIGTKGTVVSGTGYNQLNIVRGSNNYTISTVKLTGSWPAFSSCWLIDPDGVKTLGIDVKQYEVN